MSIKEFTESSNVMSFTIGGYQMTLAGVVLSLLLRCMYPGEHLASHSLIQIPWVLVIGSSTVTISTPSRTSIRPT